MAEYGELPPKKWPKERSAAFDSLPGNAQIALRRLRCAIAEDTRTNNSEYVEPRARLPEDANPITAPVISQIVTAIAALKAAGVLASKAEPKTIETSTVEEDLGPRRF